MLSCCLALRSFSPDNWVHNSKLWKLSEKKNLALDKGARDGTRTHQWIDINRNWSWRDRLVEGGNLMLGDSWTLG